MLPGTNIAKLFVAIKLSGNYALPGALSFYNTIQNSHTLVVTDEDGYVSSYNSRLRFPSLWTCQGSAEKARISEWVAHDNNAIFDLCWTKVYDVSKIRPIFRLKMVL